MQIISHDKECLFKSRKWNTTKFPMGTPRDPTKMSETRNIWNLTGIWPTLLSMQINMIVTHNGTFQDKGPVTQKSVHLMMSPWTIGSGKCCFFGTKSSPELMLTSCPWTLSNQFQLDFNWNYEHFGRTSMFQPLQCGAWSDICAVSASRNDIKRTYISKQNHQNSNG